MTASRQGATRASAIEMGVRDLKSSNIDDSRRNVEWILCELLKCNRATLYAYPERIIPADLLKRFQEMIDRRTRHEPLQYILGHTEFYGLHFEVDERVLIPRPETEQLVERALHYLKDRSSPSILDICTGSGCIPIALKHLVPQSNVSACDISEPALSLARKNANFHRVDVSFFSCDILNEEVQAPNGAPYDLILSNPPYIPSPEYEQLAPEVKNFEPEQALNAGRDPVIFYRTITKLAKNWLKPDGVLLFEIHCDFANEVSAILHDNALHHITIHEDLANLPRMVSGIFRP